MADVSTLIADLPPEIRAGSPLVPPPVALDPETQAAQEEAAALALMDARQNPLAFQQAHTHAPEEGMAARMAAGLPPPVVPPAAPVTPPVAAPATAPLAPPTSTPAAHPGTGALHVPETGIPAIQQAAQASQQAATGLGEAQAAESDEEAAARALGRERIDAQQAIINEQRAQRDRAVQAINQDQQNAYEEAHRATVPDFFGGRFGMKAAAAVSIALGEAGRGLQAFGTGANVGNTAKDIIDRSIANYMQQKRIDVDNLFKYAAARNQLGEQGKAAWATKLNDLQFEAAALHQAMADHVLEVAAASKGRISQAQAKVLAAQQAESAVQLEQKARETNFNNQLSLRRLGIESYNAQSERIRALQDKQAQVEIKIGQQIDSDLGALEKRVAKPREALNKIDDIITQMDSAYAAHDANRLAAAIVALKEGVGPLFAGGKTTGNLTKQLDAMGTTKDEIQKTLGKITGGNTVGDTQFKRLRGMAVIGAHEIAEGIGADRQAFVRKYLGPGGLANTPEKKQRFLNDLNGITSEIKVGGQPLFQEGGATSAPAQSGVPAGWNPVPGQLTKTGKQVYRGPNGELGAM